MTAGTMETIMPNLIKAIKKVQTSLKLGLLDEAIMKRHPKRETIIAKKGLIDVISMKDLIYQSFTIDSQEIGFFIVEIIR
jgi:hypothetical protein